MKIRSPHRWPAEWESQAATWLAWPHNQDTWPGHFEPVPAAVARFVREISQVQPVHILAGQGATWDLANRAVEGMAGVTLHEVATNDCWIRDYGPTFVTRVDDGSLVGIDWQYNAWGGKWPPWDRDAKVASWICRYLACPRSASPLYCEGGGLETDGLGTLLTTSSVLMNPSRNPGWSREMVERELHTQLGITKVVWVDGGGLAGDDTDGHIDQLARFVRPGVVVVAVSSERLDSNAEGLQKNLQSLRLSTAANEQPLEVHALPTPPPRFVDGQRVPESYCNFLFANGIVIVPTFRNPATDDAAVNLLSLLLPERKVIPLDAFDLILGLGAFHCASQQQPVAERSFSTAGRSRRGR